MATSIRREPRWVVAIAFVLGIAASLSSPFTAKAQGLKDVVDAALGKVHNLNAWYSWARFARSPDFAGGLRGGVFEVTFALPDIGCKPVRGGIEDACAAVHRLEQLRDSLRNVCHFLAARANSVDKCNASDPAVERDSLEGLIQPKFGLELGFAYGRFAGFELRNPVTSVGGKRFRRSLGGELEEFPAFAVYAAYRPLDRAGLFVGGRVGVSTLQDLRYRVAVDSTNAPTSVYSAASPRAVHFGALAGGWVFIGGQYQLYFDIDFIGRTIRNIDWLDTDGKSPVGSPPPGIPQSLQLRTLSLNLGFLVNFKT